jgi:hypothetical protein
MKLMYIFPFSQAVVVVVIEKRRRTLTKKNRKFKNKSSIKLFLCLNKKKAKERQKKTSKKIFNSICVNWVLYAVVFFCQKELIKQSTRDNPAEWEKFKKKSYTIMNFAVRGGASKYLECLELPNRISIQEADKVPAQKTRVD